ncbi:hypothetical protein BY458DRAFT_508510 [Sporodiniella umbellata]|nr:hypothetical protein BY458DRAFT_508510 [Sporodiniella umbellata]
MEVHIQHMLLGNMLIHGVGHATRLVVTASGNAGIFFFCSSLKINCNKGIFYYGKEKCV